MASPDQLVTMIVSTYMTIISTMAFSDLLIMIIVSTYITIISAMAFSDLLTITIAFAKPTSTRQWPAKPPGPSMASSHLG